MHRSDWEYVSYLYISGYKTGVWIGREPGFADAPNAQLYEVHVGGCGNGLYVEDVNPYGILISNSSFGQVKMVMQCISIRISALLYNSTVWISKVLS